MPDQPMTCRVESVSSKTFLLQRTIETRTLLNYHNRSSSFSVKLNGAANKQNSKDIQEVPFHDERVTLWSVFKTKRLLDSSFSMMKMTKRLPTIIKFFRPIIRRKGMGLYCFQKDGYPLQTSRTTFK